VICAHTAWRRQTVGICGAAIVVLAADLFAQGRIGNATFDTRSAAQGFEREVAAIAARGAGAWLGYSPRPS